MCKTPDNFKRIDKNLLNHATNINISQDQNKIKVGIYHKLTIVMDSYGPQYPHT